MKLWIRSQDREMLSKIDHFEVEVERILGSKTGLNTCTELGVYKTKERALEVLDEIQKSMINGAFGKLENGLGELKNVIPNPIYIYQMPKE